MNYKDPMKKQNNNDTMRRDLMTVPARMLQVREKDGEEAPGRTISGRAILFNVPSAALYSDEEEEIREIIAPGAITRELLDNSDIKFTMFHNRELILARSNKGTGTLRYDIDAEGVTFEFEAPNTEDGDKALELVRRGDLAGCSFAFAARYWDREAVALNVETVDGREIRTYTVNKIEGIFDFTLAADPAYPATSVEARELKAQLLAHDTPEVPETYKEQVRQMRQVAKNYKI